MNRIIATLPVGCSPEAPEQGPTVEGFAPVWPIVRDALLRRYQERVARDTDERLRAERGRAP